MDTNVKYEVFEGEGFPVEERLLEKGLLFKEQGLAREMMQSGHYVDGIDISKFLREDLSINLEKLELAVTLSVLMLENNSDLDITLNLRNLQEYYTIRGISGNSNKQKEERTFILGFVSAAAMEASEKDTIIVKYV